MKLEIEKIPQPLKKYPYWCVWKYERRKGAEKPTKVPYNPKTYDKSKSNDRNTFASFGETLAAYQRGGYDGLGIGLFDGMAAVDIDHCVDNGNPSAMAQDILNIMDSYAEYSPSGTGMRVVFHAPGFVHDKTRYYINSKHAGLEVYIAGCTDKYVTITGNVISDKPIEERTAAIATVLDKYMRRPETPTRAKNKAQTGAALSDEQILEKAKTSNNADAFVKLWDGDISGYPSQSEADIALCGKLAFWSGGNAETIDRLFKASKLYRADKWDSSRAGSTYGADTVKRAIANCPEFYTPSTGQGSYYVENGNVYRRMGQENRHLANFTAVPLEDVTKDDGSGTTQRYITIGGKLASGPTLPTITIPAAKLSSMTWIDECWDYSACIAPGGNNKDYFRAYIKSQCPGIPRKTIYTHTGFRKIDDKLCFLYHGGAIGADNIQCELDGGLSNYTFLDPQGISEKEALTEVMELFKLSPPEISYPLLAFTYLTPLNYFLEREGKGARLVFLLHGDTGSFKSALSLLYLAHFTRYKGRSMSSPANFQCTVNAVEKMAYDLKDVPLLVDDYHPADSQDKRRMDSMANRLARAGGDHNTRGRMNSDTSLKAAFEPRGLLIMTGEDIPTVSESGIARYVCVKFKRGLIDKSALTIRQNNAQLLNVAMQGYIKWLIRNADDIPTWLHDNDDTSLMRMVDVPGAHSRTAPAIACLLAATACFTLYAIEAGVMNEAEGREFCAKAQGIFVKQAAEQTEIHTGEKPINKFLNALSEMLTSEKKYTEGKDDKTNTSLPSDRRLGYHDDEFYYLFSSDTYAAVKAFVQEIGEYFPVSNKRLYADLAEAGLIVPGKDSNTVVVPIRGKNIRVLKLKKSALENL